MLEIACFSIKDCLVAQKSGADRIEFCMNQKLGGISPSKKRIREARSKIKGQLFLMIRPRGGNFIYSKGEIKEMKNLIRFAKKLKYDGVVFGVLQKNRKVDFKVCQKLVKLANPLDCTFHKAFDYSKDLFESLKDCISCGFDNILSSGGTESVVNGMFILKHLVKKAKKRITIIPAGGVRANNMPDIRHVTKSKVYHSSAINPKTGKISGLEIIRMKRLASSGAIIRLTSGHR